MPCIAAVEILRDCLPMWPIEGSLRQWTGETLCLHLPPPLVLILLLLPGLEKEEGKWGKSSDVQEWEVRQNCPFTHTPRVLWKVLPLPQWWLWSCHTTSCSEPVGCKFCMITMVVALFKEFQWGGSASPSTSALHVTKQKKKFGGDDSE